MVSNEEAASPIEVIITLVILAIICVLGGIGNFFVILVYRKKVRKNETAVFFILVLAISDLIVCLIIVPCTMAVEYLAFKISSSFCKSYYFLNTSNLLFSTMLISAIALDRYLCICHPMRQYLTVKGAVKLIISLALFSFSFGTVASFLVESRPSSDTTHDIVSASNNSNTNNYLIPHVSSNKISEGKYICDEIKHFNKTTAAQRLFYDIFEKMNHTIYICSILSVMILYSLIFKVIVRIRRTDTRKELTLINAATVDNNNNNNNNNNNDNNNNDIANSNAVSSSILDNSNDNAVLEPILQNQSENTNNNSNNNNNNNTKVTPKPRSRSIKSQKAYNKLANDIKKCQKITQKKQGQKTKVPSYSLISNAAMQNMRSAAMLFVVAVVYIIAFVPVLMIVSFKLFDLNIILYNLYYLNNAANPLIYCFMNSKFRRELTAMLMRRAYDPDPI